jgi:hypothetical protein
MLNTVVSVSTVIFSGIASSFIYENRLFSEEISEFLDRIHCNMTLEQFFLTCLIVVYALCILINLIIHVHDRIKALPRSLKSVKHGRKRLAEDFHKSIINDIVVGVSFVSKVVPEAELDDIEKMYLYEATYYFIQANEQIEKMRIYDNRQHKVNKKLVDEIGYRTLFTTLNVFKNSVDKVKKYLEGSDSEEYKNLNDISENLGIHISIMKNKSWK